jgi:hypothetical protein
MHLYVCSFSRKKTDKYFTAKNTTVPNRWNIIFKDSLPAKKEDNFGKKGRPLSVV